MTSRQANLAAMRVPAQEQMKSRSGRFGESLGAVREQDRATAFWNARADFCEIVCFVEMRIVDSTQPQAPTIPLKKRRLVQQNREADFLQFGDHFEKVVVAEDSESRGCQHGANPCHLAQAGAVVAIHSVPEIPRQNRRIMRRGTHEILNRRRQFGVEIAMQIAELEQAEAIERRWQRGEFPLLRDKLDIKKSSPQRLAKAEDIKHPADNGIKWKQALESKNPLALVLEFRALAGLAFQPLLEKRGAEPFAEFATHGGILDQRITRPSWPGFSPGFGT